MNDDDLIKALVNARQPVGCSDAEVAIWDEQCTLPTSVPGLTLLAQLIEARSWATP